MSAPPFRLFFNTIILLRKKKGLALVPVVHFLFFDFTLRNTLLQCLRILIHEKIIFVNPAGAKVFFLPLATA
jgi:hypothetical protein